ncbi:MAG: zinc ribbon domain-containing protein [Chloroflexota bacterium]|nr:zinc ribbon domain-containing protein [Chloroflexota bacterium]
MPVYEYYCSDCHTTFDALRSMAAAADPMECSHCGASKHVNRTITTFARVGVNAGVESFGGTQSGGSASPSFGGGCCGGACGCH